MGLNKLDSPVLITDGDMRVTLPVLRSLAKQGITTYTAASRTRALSFFSKYCEAERFLYPSSRENLDSFLKAVKKICEKIDPCILFPIGEWSMLPISEHRDLLPSHVTLPFGNHESVMKTFDKSRTITLATEEGVPIPKTFFAENVADLKDASRELTYPAVIKPRTSWVWNQGEALFSRPHYVGSANELISVYKDIHDTFPHPLIQEYIPGSMRSVGVLCDHSRVRAMCCIGVQRTQPITGGNSTMRMSMRLDPVLKDYTERLMKALEWHGVAEVEFRMDSRDSVPKLMEINGRFWGSLEVAIASGVDLPYLLYKLLVDDEVDSVTSYKIGVKQRWLEGELIHLSSVLKNEGICPGEPLPNKWHTLIDFLKMNQGRYDCFYWDDPLPFLSRFLWGDLPRILLKRLNNKLPKIFKRNN